MAYSNKTLVERAMTQSLTSATPPQEIDPVTGQFESELVDLINVGNNLDTNLITEENINQYIQWADNQIDSAISQLYKTPLCPKADFETTLAASIDEYNYIVILNEDCGLVAGDTILLSDGINEEEYVIESSMGNKSYELTLDSYDLWIYWQADETRVLRIKYPNPIPFISAKLAASNVFEKYFMAQSSPGQSEYGKFLRAQAAQMLNLILSGAIILHGANRIGRRFYEPRLVEDYGFPRNKGEVNIEDLG